MSAIPESERHPIVGESAPSLPILRASDNESVPLASLWQDGPAVLVFLRHFGCTFCREHTAELRRDSGRFTEYGATVALITVTNPADTAAYCADRAIAAPFLCLSDPDKRAYQAYGLMRGSASELLSPHVIRRGFQATLHGHFVGMPKGDPFQMPGVFIVDRTGIVQYAHRHKDAADNPPNADLFAILKTLALRG